MHPGANVACDLILWLALFMCAGIASLSAMVELEEARFNQLHWDETMCVDGECAGGAQLIEGQRRRGELIAAGASLAYIVM